MNHRDIGPDEKDEWHTQRISLSRKQAVGPPRESEIWPERYRRKWRSIFPYLFAGKCLLYAYSCEKPTPREWRERRFPPEGLRLCTNHPSNPGGLVEVRETDTCRNFRAKRWRGPRTKTAPSPGAPAIRESDGTVRRISVGQGLFATVDARDYPRLSRYKWYAYRHGRRVYAVCRTKGKTVYMHRMVMRPRPGRLVDHINGNGLNSRRGNLRVCTPAQNRANARPCGGASGFVGVYRKGNKWRASITCRREFYYLGLFDDPVAAAKAGDRKAYALHGPYAYLNFPEDFRRADRRRSGGRRAT